MKYNQLQSKSILPSDRYHFTIRQAYRDDSEMGRLILCATVDTGEHAYRNVLLKFENNHYGMGKLKQLADALNRVWVGSIEDEGYPEQFLAWRFNALCEVHMDTFNGVWRNVLSDYKPATGRAEYDVTKPKSDEHFFTTKKKKRNPLCTSQQ
jgi:hypothetical protein